MRASGQILLKRTCILTNPDFIFSGCCCATKFGIIDAQKHGPGNPQPKLETYRSANLNRPVICRLSVFGSLVCRGTFRRTEVHLATEDFSYQNGQFTQFLFPLPRSTKGFGPLGRIR